MIIQTIARKIACKLNHITESDNPKAGIEVLQYGIECILNSVITICAILTFGFFTHSIVLCLIWMVSFSLLRSVIGGYHAPNHESCILFSVFFCIITVMLCKHILVSNLIIILTSIISLLFIIKYVPLYSMQNNILTDDKKKTTKYKALSFSLLSSFLSLISKNNFPSISHMLSITLFSVILLAETEIIRRILKNIY